MTSSTQTFIQTQQGQIATQCWQPDNLKFNTPIILLHDSLGSIAQWRDFPAILADTLNRPVIAYDRLGFGQSNPHPNPPSYEFISQQAQMEFPQIKDALDINEYYLLGHSVGGAMAVNIAAIDKNCQGIITLAAQAFVEQRTLEGIKAAQKAFANDKQFSRLKKWHGEKTQWVLDAWINIWLDEKFANWSLDYCISDVACKVLAIHGELDEFGSRDFAHFIANNSGKKSTNKLTNRAIILEDCGHIPHKEKQQQVLSAIKAFI